MKMQRSHCENENIQFVQELAEVDGPFESPININFRDLTKLELPSLVWNRAEVSPKKMKITNTGHTVIISGKWKCERPYLTGGPLSGKYVFSQIHFHWGQDDCRGSEHQVCGEEFPLEMHVAHFKTEYLTQECALREKDGMVVVVYLFKLQDEPNASLKKILNLLPNVKEASTSHAIDPRPILSLCNPFTDDYFMYWGSVVTSTCAHILLWIISREPFGISREQVKEFRKLLDTSRQPICRNSRDIQPLHKRNVFHVNASKHLDDAMLPIKKVLGCYCKESEDKVCPKSASNDCNCQAFVQNQEDVEGNTVVEQAKMRNFSDTEGMQAVHCKASLPNGCFVQHSIVVQTATIHSVPVLVKRFESEPVGSHCCLDNFKQTKSEGDAQLNLVSKSCCFFPTKEVGIIKARTEKKKVREKKKPFNSVRAFSHLMDSLEAIKNQTFKKLKEIESINQEIKGMKPFCYESEDKRWLRRIEKIISRQKRFTLKSSQGYFGELKKLARECNFDKFFDGKAFQVGDNNNKMVWLNDNEVGNGALPYSYNYIKREEVPKVEMTPTKQITSSQAIKFSSKAQKLIQSFFEDIKESDDLQESVKKDINLKRIESLYGKQAGDSNPVPTVNKGYITQRMFTLGNLGDRFFKAVSSDNFEMGEDEWSYKKDTEEVIIIKQDCQTEKTTYECETEKPIKIESPNSKQKNEMTLTAKNQQITSLHRGNAVTEFTKASTDAANGFRKGIEEDKNLEISSDSETQVSDDEPHKPYLVKESKKKSLRVIKKKLSDLANEKLLNELNMKIAQSNFQRSSSYLSTESTETQRMIAKMNTKIRKIQSKKDVWEQKSSLLFTIVSSKGLYGKNLKKQNIKNLEGYYMQKKSLKKRKSQRIERVTDKSSWDLSSTSKEESTSLLTKPKWKRPTKNKFKLDLKKSSRSTLGSTIDNSPISPERKKLKLDSNKKSKVMTENKTRIESEEMHSKDTETQENFSSDKCQEDAVINNENFESQNKSFDSNSTETDQKLHFALNKDNSSNGSGFMSRASTNKSQKPTSAESTVREDKKQYLEKSDETEFFSRVKTEQPKEEFQHFVGSKPITKNWSLTNITTTPKMHSTDISQKIFMESIEDRRQSSREVSELTKTLESPRKVEENIKVIITKNLSTDTSSDRNKKSDEDRDQKITNQSSLNIKDSKTQSVSQVEFNVRFFTTASSQLEEELLSKTHPSEGKCGDAEKRQFLDAELEENNEDLLLVTDSNKSFSKDASKGDAEPQFAPADDPKPVDNKERETPVSFASIKKNPTSRHHSVETLVSATKTLKRKSKKRPHCCKRSSRHYIRKNSSIFKKPNKVESKQLNLLNLTDEEQLKIISANVAKYLKQKLVEQKADYDEADISSFKDIEEAVYKNLVSSEETKETVMQENTSSPKETVGQENSSPPKETVAQESDSLPKEKVTQEGSTPPKEKVAQKSSSPAKETKIKKPDTPKANVKVKEKPKKSEKKKENKNATLVIKAPDEPESKKSEKPSSASSKPVHNFIKRNKQMAATYKRTTEKNTEVKKKEEEKPKEEVSKLKPKTPLKKKDKSSPQKPPAKNDQAKPENATLQKNEKQLEKTKKGSRVKSPKAGKNSDSKNQKSKSFASQIPKSEIKSKPKPEPKVEPKPAVEAEQPSELVKCQESANDTLPPPIVLRKIPQPKKRFIPAYMMTSYLPPPLEIVESQKGKMNKYLLSMNSATLDNYIPDVLQEVKNRKRDKNKSDTIFEKELEYLIKLQMCLNEEITTNIENSMNYVKTLLTPEYPLPYIDAAKNKGVVLVEMKDLECSSSCSDLTDVHKYYLRKDTSESKSDSYIRDKQINCIKMPKESGDFNDLIPIHIPDTQEDFNSDSSYDCKISITLNPNLREGEGEIQSYDTITYLDENYNSQTTINLEGSSSQSTVAKPHRKRRKENEISIEMKQKVLEILEGEIRKRENDIEGGRSSEILSDGKDTMKGEDSDGNNRSHSTESSCDMEMLTQISETMKQYLSDFKERKLKEIIIESSDKESKDDESVC